MKNKMLYDIKVTDLNGDLYYVRDIRASDFYLTKNEAKDWEKRNILYNTLWFYSNKSNGYPEVEYSDEIINTFNRFTPFKDWEVVYHAGGKVFNPACKHSGKGRFVADIMTGWWIPLKSFLNLKSTSSKKELVEELILNLENNQLVTNDISLLDLLAWFKNLNSKINEQQLVAFLKFLEVIYTKGNIIPAPENPGQGGGRGGPGLDSWQHKLSHRINCGNGASENWNTYIATCYNFKKENSNWVNFVESNFLEGYFEDNKTYRTMISFWPKNKDLNLNSGNNATLDDWATYFENATQCIVSRNIAIDTAK